MAERIVEHSRADLCISSITLAGIHFGAERVNARRLHRSIERFVHDMVVLPFDESCARTYGKLAAALAARGETIGDFDTMIGAHALTLGLTLVTNNARHFARVPGLRTENWL